MISGVRLLPLALWLGLSACGPAENRLEGSIGLEYNLRFDKVRAEWVQDELVIRYLFGSGRTRVEPCRLTVPRAVTELEGERPLDHVRIEHFFATRQPDGTFDTAPPFPVVEDGWLRIDKLGKELHQEVRGEFSALMQGGKNLTGAFLAYVNEPG